MHKNPQPTYVSHFSAAPSPVVTLNPIPAHPKVLLVGDSYSHGTGADNMATQGYGALLAARHGWQLTINSVPGGGYVNPGPSKLGPMSAQITQAAKSAKPDLLVVEEGLNDATLEKSGPSAPAYLRAVSHTVTSDLTALRLTWPDVPIFVVGCFDPAGDNRANRKSIDNIIRQSAATVIGAAFASPFDLTYPVVSDRAHPTTEGHRIIADWLDAQLAKAAY